MRLLEAAEVATDLDLLVATPLRARLLAGPRTPEWEVCDTWDLLHRGRGALCRSDPDQWFETEELEALPIGLVAELYASSERLDKFQAIISQSKEARAYILNLPKYVYDANPNEWRLIQKCVDLAKLEEARQTAAQALQQG